MSHAAGIMISIDNSGATSTVTASGIRIANNKVSHTPVFSMWPIVIAATKAPTSPPYIPWVWEVGCPRHHVNKAHIAADASAAIAITRPAGPGAKASSNWS